MNAYYVRQVCVLTASLWIAAMLSACSQENESAQGPNRGAVGSRVSSINIPVPGGLAPFIGPDRINGLHLKITPRECKDGVIGTTIDRFFLNFGSSSGSLTSEKIRIGCNYALAMSLGRAVDGSKTLERIFLTNDSASTWTKIQAMDSTGETIRVVVRVFPTQDGNNILGIPGDPIDMQSDDNTPQNQNGGSQPNPSSSMRNWKVVLMASDQGNQSSWIQVFDNARNWLFRHFEMNGISANNIRQLSLKPQFQGTEVKPTTVQNFTDAVASLNATGPNDACLIHMTSHGSKDGFNIGYNKLSPGSLGSALDVGCGNKPTVVLVSACYSGLYLLDSSGLKKPNRIILTAARHDRTSFGCSSEFEYTYWDSCLIEHLPKSSRFKDLANNIQACITAKESGMATPSLPQAFIGAEVQELLLPRLR
jgi:hypothetical protein